MENQLIGKTISHFKILKKLGQGSMGIVYKAQDLKLKRTVALKFLPIYLADDKQARLRFIREAQVTASLQHPNIAITYDFIEFENEKIIVMEYLEGKTLAEKIRRRQSNLKQILEWSINIAEGLAAAHTKGIIHRDIKPANIMITKDGGTKITDFGIAKLRGTPSLTPPGERIGTLDYAAPELVMGDKGDYRSDIFSFGVVLYELLTGQRPFFGEHDAAVVYAIVNEIPIPVTKICKDIPPDFERLVMKMLDKNREKRYQSCDDLLLELKQLKQDTLEDQLTSPLKKSKEIRKRKPIKINTKSNSLKVAMPFSLAILLLFVFLQFKSFFLKQASPLRQVPIAVMPFENQTGDESLDYLKTAIPNLLITSLEQSQSLRVTNWERLLDLLKQMGKEDMENVDKDLSFELCRRNNIEMIVQGSFTKAGDMFATDVKVLEVDTKQLLKSTRAKGGGVASILENQIDELSWEISKSVGISANDIETTRHPIADVTTTSIEAYNYYLRGTQELDNGYLNKARRFFEKAVELDSTFAIAYNTLGWVCVGLWDPSAAEEAFERAKRYASKATHKERLYIDLYYAKFIEGNLEKYHRILQESNQEYEDDKTTHLLLGGYYVETLNYHKAIEEFTKVVNLDPDHKYAIYGLANMYLKIKEFEKALYYIHKHASLNPGQPFTTNFIALIYFSMGRFDDAITKYKEVLEVEPEYIQSYFNLGYLYAIRENPDEAFQYFDQYIAVAPSPGERIIGYWWRGFYNYWLGNFEQALADLRKAEELINTMGNALDQAHIDLIKAWIYYSLGDTNLILKCYSHAVNVFNEAWPRNAAYCTGAYLHYLGLEDLKNDRIDSSRVRLDEIMSLQIANNPNNKKWAMYFYNNLYGEILLTEGLIQKAIAVCEKTLSLGDHWGMNHISLLHYNLPLITRDVLARAYTQQGELDKAITEYERLITSIPNEGDICLIHPMFNYRLARLYEQKGWSEKAIAQYDKLLNIWKYADEDLPELIDAKARLAKLREFKRLK